jgi:WD40 repeat protein
VLTDINGNSNTNGTTSSSTSTTVAATVLDPEPYRVCCGHTADVVDLSWSRTTGLLLSAGVDCTVRLWAPLKSSECQYVFEVRTLQLMTVLLLDIVVV